MDDTIQNAKILSICDHSSWSERTIQDLIAEDPSILGLGPLVLRDKERVQPSKGKLDLLLQNAEGDRWYEVEIQLGSTDPSHIIRTIEYWDVERKRYPNIQHTAVIVAEEITNRFFNVISLFNQAIPLVAMRVSAVQVDNKVGLLFTKILDMRTNCAASPDLKEFPAVDRSYWEQRTSHPMMQAMDEAFALAREINPAIELKFNQQYVGTSIDGSISNFVTFKPQKKSLKLAIHIDQSMDVDQQLKDHDIENEYISGPYPRYRLSLSLSEVKDHKTLLLALMKKAYIQNEGEFDNAVAQGAAE